MKDEQVNKASRQLARMIANEIQKNDVSIADGVTILMNAVCAVLSAVAIALKKDPKEFVKDILTNGIKEA